MDPEDCVRRLNSAWQQGDWKTVTACFREDAVMLLPHGEELLRGRDAIVATYHEFFDIATLHALDIEAVEVFDYGAAAMCHMRFTIDYTIDDEREEASGVEVYTLVPDAAGRAVIAWRTQQLFGDEPFVTLEEEPVP
jgi:uncharacterized protein (TIGR02246 family)